MSKEDKNDYSPKPEMGTGENFYNLVLSPYEIHQWIMMFKFSPQPPQLKKYIIRIAAQLNITTTHPFKDIVDEILIVLYTHCKNDRKIQETYKIINRVHRRFMTETKRSKTELQTNEWMRVLRLRRNIKVLNDLDINHEMWTTLISRIQQVYKKKTETETEEGNIVTVVDVHDVDYERNWNRLLKTRSSNYSSLTTKRPKQPKQEALEEKAPDGLITVTYRSELLSRPTYMNIVNIDVTPIHNNVLKLSVTIMGDPMLFCAQAEEDFVIVSLQKPITLTFEFFAPRPNMKVNRFCRKYFSIPSTLDLSVGASWVIPNNAKTGCISNPNYQGVLKIGVFDLQLDDLLKQLDVVIFRKAEIERQLPSWIKCLPITIFPIICSFLSFP
jgi:hypothetical protein